MVGWHHRLNGYVFEQTPGDSEEQGSLACCSPWTHKELDPNEQLNSNRCQYNIYEYYIAWKKIYDVLWKIKQKTLLSKFFFFNLCPSIYREGFPDDSDSKESACNAGDMGLIPGLGRFPGREHGN